VFPKLVLCNVKTKHNDLNIHVLQTEDTNVESGYRIYNFIIFKSNRQRTCNVTLRRFRVTIVAYEKQQVLHILRVCL